MTQNHNILQELKDLESSLASQSLNEVYAVPMGYFDALVSSVLNRIKAMEATDGKEELQYLSPLLHSISRDPLYKVPVGYFEQLAVTMPAIASTSADPAEELTTLSPLLSGLKKEMPYQVPPDYFETMAVKKTGSAKVFRMAKTSLFKYAVAAVFIGIISTTAVLLITKNTVSPQSDSFAWVAKNMKKVSTDEIKEFVQLADETLPQSEVLVSVDRSAEVKELIRDVPDTELQNFLNEIPEEETASGDEIILN